MHTIIAYLINNLIAILAFGLAVISLVLQRRDIAKSYRPKFKLERPQYSHNQSNRSIGFDIVNKGNTVGALANITINNKNFTSVPDVIVGVKPPDNIKSVPGLSIANIYEQIKDEPYIDICVEYVDLADRAKVYSLMHRYRLDLNGLFMHDQGQISAT